MLRRKIKQGKRREWKMGYFVATCKHCGFPQKFPTTGEHAGRDEL